jgi:hypothetical protein
MYPLKNPESRKYAYRNACFYGSFKGKAAVRPACTFAGCLLEVCKFFLK